LFPPKQTNRKAVPDSTERRCTRELSSGEIVTTLLSVLMILGVVVTCSVFGSVAFIWLIFR